VRSCVSFGLRRGDYDGETVSVLRASCDSTKEGRSIKEGRGKSGDSSPRNLRDPALRPNTFSPRDTDLRRADGQTTRDRATVKTTGWQ